MNIYKVTAVIADATGYVHNYANGYVEAATPEQALELTNQKYGELESGADIVCSGYYKIEFAQKS